MENIQERANILTEEDLNKISSTYKGFNPILIAVIDSHRALCSANAELSFENMKYKQLVEAVLQAHRERGAIMTEACGDREVVSLAYELEATK